MLLLALLWVALSSVCQAWTSVAPVIRSTSRTLAAFAPLYSSTTMDDSASSTSEDSSSDDEDDDEYEYIEYEILTEKEFMGSEWLVGTVMETRPDKIVETWCRLATKEDGKNVAIWGDGSQGTWSLDVANQFLSMSKENFFGKDIWAGVVEDYYFTAGTVRGWSIISPADVKGQWQAKRLGVDPDEAGTPPWFEIDEDEEEESSESPKLEAKAEEVSATLEGLSEELAASGESKETVSASAVEPTDGESETKED